MSGRKQKKTFNDLQMVNAMINRVKMDVKQF